LVKGTKFNRKVFAKATTFKEGLGEKAEAKTVGNQWWKSWYSMRHFI